MGKNSLVICKTQIWLTFLLVITATISSFSQVIKNYDSIYKTESGIKGHAKFEYLLNTNNEIVKAGKFSFYAEAKDTVHTNSVTRNTWEGTFDNNLKEGDWVYTKNTHKVKIGEIQDLSVSSDVYTYRVTIKAHYVAGIPDGNWELKEQTLINGNPDATTKVIDFHFDEGKINKTFNAFSYDANNNKISITGNAVNGLMEGEWIYKYRKGELPVEENRDYTNGFLKRLTKSINGELTVNQTFPLSDKILESLDDKTPQAANVPVSLLYSDGYPRESRYVESQAKGKALLTQSFKDIFQQDPGLISTYGFPLGTNRMIYELSKSEQDVLKEWSTTEFQYRSKVNQLKTDEELHNIQTKSETLEVISKWVDTQLELLEYIDSWNNIISKNEIIYYNRNNKELIAYTKNILHKDSITLDSGQSKTFTYNNNKTDQEGFLPIVYNSLNERIKVVDSLSNLYSETIDNLKVENAIGKTTSEIKKSLETLRLEYTTPHPDNKTQRLYVHLRDDFFGENFNTAFNSLNNDTISLPNRKIVSDSLWNRVQIAEKIYHRIDSITKNHKKLDSLYTEYVSDPFTFTDKIPKRTKKRLYERGYEDTYKAYINKAEEAATIEEMYKNLTTIFLLQKRFYFLYDKETESLEKKLRNRTSVQKKLEILQI